ncbi:MAG TPA: ABC transporter permease subunit [Chthonomonadaceae bacterium]|nr:ABC transporter permease subunit [Chthonomonadaceae bacterium]
MAIFTIAGLTLQEAWRKRTVVGALLLGALVLGLSLLLLVIRARMSFLVDIHAPNWDADRFDQEYGTARILITLMCLFFLRVLGMLFGLVLAGGAVSAEIESGLLAVILAKPVPRWQILIGKWLGLNLVAVIAVLAWTAAVWLSLQLQTGVDLRSVIAAGPYLSLYAVISCTLTLTFSTVFQRVLGTALTLILAVISWCDGIFNFLATHFEVPSLHTAAGLSCLLMPQGYVAWWVRSVTGEVATNPLIDSPLKSSRLLLYWGQSTLHVDHLDGVYVACYIIGVLAIGILLFQRREILG